MFNGAFTAVQQFNGTDILFTDTSTGSDTNITSRRIYPRNSAGTLVLPTGNTLGYINWPLPLATPLTVTVLTKDLALNIEVIWVSSAPIGGSTYDVTNLNVFTKYTQTFIYNRSQDLAAQQSIANDSGWFKYYSMLQSLVDTAQLCATTDILDIGAAQSSLDQAFFIMANQSKFF